MEEGQSLSDNGPESRIESLVLNLARENEALREELRQTRAAFAVWAEVAVTSCRKLEKESGRTGRNRWNHQTLIGDLQQLSQSLKTEGSPLSAVHGSKTGKSETNDRLCA